MPPTRLLTGSLWPARAGFFAVPYRKHAFPRVYVFMCRRELFFLLQFFGSRGYPVDLWRVRGKKLEVPGNACGFR